MKRQNDAKAAIYLFTYFIRLLLHRFVFSSGIPLNLLPFFLLANSRFVLSRILRLTIRIMETGVEFKHKLNAAFLFFFLNRISSCSVPDIPDNTKLAYGQTKKSTLR